MAAKSRMEKYRREIVDLINCGASIASTWKIINSKVHADGKISYTAFYHYVKKNIR